MNPSSLPWDFALILLVLAVVIPWRSAVRIRSLLHRATVSSAQRIAIYVSTISFQWMLTIVVLWRAVARGITEQQLGLDVRNPGRTIIIAAALTALLAANQFVSLHYLGRARPDRNSFLFRFADKVLPHAPMESLVFIVLSFTAGISEEIIYRGFVFAVAVRMFATASPVASFGAALIISSALFAIGHIYQGKHGLITTFVVGMIFASARAWTGNLIAPMAAHIAVDLVAGLCAPGLLHAGSTDVTAKYP